MEFIQVWTNEGAFQVEVESMRSFLIDSMGFDDVENLNADDLMVEIEESESIDSLLEWCGLGYEVTSKELV